MRGRLLTGFACAAALACVRAPVPPAPVEVVEEAPLVLVGDVTHETAILWARGSAAGRLRALATNPTGGEILAFVSLDPERDFTAKLVLGGLAADSRYAWRIWLEGAEHLAATGTFRTAPAPDDASPVAFAFGGDVGGQDACRDAQSGYAIFDEIARRAPDFFVGLGDMIYADSVCSPVGRFGNAQVPRAVAHATDLAGYRAHWRYNREDTAFRRLASVASYVAVWDDHETVNDVGPLDDTRTQAPYASGAPLLPIALRAFFEYNPVPESPHMPGRLYRSLRWGRHLELFVLDTRQYRDSDRAPDSPETPKTMLGREQRTWLEQRVGRSDATWKVIVSSVPIAIPTGTARPGKRDGWASGDTDTGYEEELRAIFRALAANGAENCVWITTDVHFASAYRYAPLPERPDFRPLEVVTGPLHAAFATRDEFDPTFAPERLFRHAVPDPAKAMTLDEARGFFNFGVVAVDARGRLTVEVVNARGERIWDLALDPR